MNPNPYHLYLPKLWDQGNDNSIAPPSVLGAWDDKQASERLDILAKALEVPPVETEVHSIPDPWARMILFDRALFDSKHILHKRILGEWRGVLALIGLKDWRKFNGLKIQPVQLSPQTVLPGSFSAVLERATPDDEDLLSAGSTWKQIFILRWHGEPHNLHRPTAFAVTSPATLVATGASYAGAFGQGEVEWFDGTVLRDPTEKLSPAERLALAEWLLHVRSELAHERPSRRKSGMLDMLEAFAMELDRKAQLRDDLADMLSEHGIGIREGVYRAMDRPHKPDSATLSQVEIVCDRQDAPVYVLVKPDLPDDLKKPAKEITVFRNETLQMVERMVQQKRVSSGSFGKDAKDRQVNWCTPAFFFQSHLIYERSARSDPHSDADTTAFPGCRKIATTPELDSRHIVLPLQEKVAQMFTADYLQRNFSVAWQPEGSAVCRLRLELRTAFDKEPRPGAAVEAKSTWVTVTHVYSGEEQLKRVQRLPAVGVWPDFIFEPEPVLDAEVPGQMASRWRRYYLFESWRDMRRRGDFLVTPLTSQNSDSRHVTQGEDVFRIHELTQFPEFLLCHMPAEGDTASLVDSSPKGLLMPRRPDTRHFSAPHAAALGIDFGTTGTVIYRTWLDNQDSVSRMSFKDRLLWITGSDQNVMKTASRELFIPARERSAAKMLSVFQEFRTTERGENRKAVLDGNVLFANDEKPTVFIDKNHEGIRSDLKWGDDDDAARNFLAQLLIESVAELVYEGASEIDLRYSYPTAFSRRDVRRWNGIWGTVRDIVQTATTVPIETNGNKLENREAVAATRFFSDSRNVPEKINVERGALTIDIGGGTSDLAFWSKDTSGDRVLMAHLSVLFAGRDLFLGPIQKRSSILTDIDADIRLDGLTTRSETPEAFKAQLDAIISSRGEALLKKLPLKDRVPSVKGFLKIIEFGLCGLGFYAGLLIGRLAHTGSYTPGRRLQVFIGGNGSNLMKWCALNDFSKDTDIHEAFARCMQAACALGAPAMAATQIDVTLSTKPKEEVAFGLVAKGTTLKVSSESQDFIQPLPGERYVISIPGGPAPRTCEWSDSPDEDELRLSRVEVDPDLPVFKVFLQAMKLRLDENTLDGIGGTINDRFYEVSEKVKQEEENEDAIARTMDELMREPVFIMALKAVLEKKINDWAATV